MDLERIRNFAIIAHVDHGKSTLADRILEHTGALDERERRDQFLDKMELERERGITIKAQAVCLGYKSQAGESYRFNLIDTPGHVDFSYEVSRSLAACEGVLLVVDAAQGVEAQTLANVYLAIENDLEIVIVLNKVDLPGAEPERVLGEIEEIIGLDTSNAILASAKTGLGMDEVLEAVVEEIPPPVGDPDAPLQALIFDSWFDPYQGVITLIRVVQGTLRAREKIKMMATGSEYEVNTVGVNAPHPTRVDHLKAGDVGFMIASIKAIGDARVGDTITHVNRLAEAPLDGFVDVKPMLFAGVFPCDPSEYGSLREALEKLQLNDASFTWEPETSAALGFGFRCGFLGLLHMEIIQERLEREYGLDLITTAPNVAYRAYLKDGSVQLIQKPSDMPDPMKLDYVEEPLARIRVHVPADYVGVVLRMCQERRGIQISMDYSSDGKVVVCYDVPFAEVVFDFYDKLKSSTRGYASFDYELTEYQRESLVKLDILVNGETVDALSTVVHRSRSHDMGKALTSKLKEFIPRQHYEVAIQAAIGRKVIARTNVRAYRKDVTAKCYGGDISRKRKLLEKQKAGKKRMKQVGSVEIPQKAFLAVLSIRD